MEINCTGSFCENKFNKYDEWISHIKLIHVTNELFYCCFCLNTFPKLWRMNRHSKSGDLRKKTPAAVLLPIEVNNELCLDSRISHAQYKNDSESDQRDFDWNVWYEHI